jgi:glutathione reductase (NADPH)
MTTDEYDLFVIGGGSGGVRAARIAAGYGASVAIAEEYRMGGTCVIRGCVPKKLLVYASQVRREIEDGAGFGWSIPQFSFDWPTLITNKDREIARLESVYTANVERSGVRLIKGRATFNNAHTIQISTGEIVTAKKVLIATGGRPNNGAAIPGIEHVISSDDVFHLERLPSDIVIQGGGYIALEFACICNGLGSRVTLVHRGENVLRGFDEDVRKHVRSEMESAGIAVRTGVVVTGVEKVGSRFTTYLSDGTDVRSDQVMFAIGRHPNVQGLGLEKAGVALNPSNGGIAVDEFSMTSVPSVYAVGDVTHRMNLTPFAIREGHAFADSVFGGRPTRVDHTGVPTAVFSEPQVGTVGLTETQARSQYAVVEVYKTDFRPMKSTMSGRANRVLMKLIVDGSTDRVLGCHVVGPDAAEIVQVVAIAVKLQARKSDFDATMALHPTAAEELVTMRNPTARYLREARSDCCERQMGGPVPLRRQ